MTTQKDNVYTNMFTYRYYLVLVPGTVRVCIAVSSRNFCDFSKYFTSTITSTVFIMHFQVRYMVQSWFYDRILRYQKMFILTLFFSYFLTKPKPYCMYYTYYTILLVHLQVRYLESTVVVLPQMTTFCSGTHSSQNFSVSTNDFGYYHNTLNKYQV